MSLAVRPLGTALSQARHRSNPVRRSRHAGDGPRCSDAGTARRAAHSRRAAGIGQRRARRHLRGHDRRGRFEHVPSRLRFARKALRHRGRRIRRGGVGLRWRRRSWTSISSTAAHSIRAVGRFPPRRRLPSIATTATARSAMSPKLPASATAAGARASASAISTTTDARTCTSPTSAPTVCIARSTRIDLQTSPSRPASR